MSSHTSLDAASQDRKARLAQLSSLKRKQPSSATDDETSNILAARPRSRSASPDVTSKVLSGRNYDPMTRGPKLGFENAPSSEVATIESQAATLSRLSKAQTEKDEVEDKPLDLFKLQPKKPNWDLKRDLQKKLELLNMRTDNAIARIVRDRIQKAQKEAQRKAANNGGTDSTEDKVDELAGMDGNSLVEAMHLREKEGEDEENRERQRD